MDNKFILCKLLFYIDKKEERKEGRQREKNRERKNLSPFMLL